MLVHGPTLQNVEVLRAPLVPVREEVSATVQAAVEGGIALDDPIFIARQNRRDISRGCPAATFS